MCVCVCVCVSVCAHVDITPDEAEFSLSLSLMANFIRYLFPLERRCGAWEELICRPDVQIFFRRQTVGVLDFDHSVGDNCIPLTHTSMLQAQQKRLGSRNSVYSQSSLYFPFSPLSLARSLWWRKREMERGREGWCVMTLSLTVSIQQAAKDWQQHYKDWDRQWDMPFST